MKRALLLASIVLSILAATSTVCAAPQSKGNSTITGVVLGPDDKPVANASVSYQASYGSSPHVVRTDSHGHFTISKLRADNYDLRASGKGVFSEWQKNVSVRAGATKEVTLNLIYAKQIPKAYTKSSAKH